MTSLKNRKCQAVFFSAMSLFLLFASVCAAAPAQSASQAAGSGVVWKVATIAPRGMGMSILWEKEVLPKVKEATKGAVQYKIYWSGVMGDNAEMVRKMKAGDLEAAGLDALGTSMAAKEFSVLQLPFLFSSYDEVDYVRAKMLPSFKKALERNGFCLLMWLDQDFDQIYSSKYELSDPKQFAHAMFFNYGGTLEKKVYEALGAKTAAQEPPDKVVTQVKSGAVDSGMAPAMWVAATQLYPSFRYVNTVKMRYSPGVVVCTKKARSSISEENWKKLESLSQDLTKGFLEGIRRDNAKCLAGMVKYGLKSVSMTPENEEALRKATRPVWDELAGNLYSKELLKEVESRLKEFSKKKK